MDFTCVEIKNIKYIKLIPLNEKCEKELDLTTIHKDQDLAYLNLFYIDDEKNKHLLKHIEVNKIRPGRSGIPELHLAVQYDGKRYYKIVLKLNGYIYHNSIIDIRSIRKKRSIVPVVLLSSAAVLIVSALLFLGIRSLQSRDVKDVNSGAYVSSNVSSSRDSGSTSTGSTGTGSTNTGSTNTGSTNTGSTNTGSTGTGSTGTGSTGTVSTKMTIAETEDNSADSNLEPKPLATLIDDEAIVYFHPNSTELTEDTVDVLEEILAILKNNNNLDVEIIGHCAFYGTEKGRQEISKERAENVYSYFLSKGWEPDLKPQLTGKGHQEIVTRDPKKQNLNRRVEISITSREEG